MVLQKLEDALDSVRGLLFGRSFSLTPLKYNPTAGTLEELSKDIFGMDAVVSDNEQRSISVTNYPLESGGSFAEHANQLAFTLSVNGVISNASMSYFFLSPKEVASSSVASLAKRAGLDGYQSKTQAAYDKLTKWAETGQPLLVRTKFQQAGYYKGTGLTRRAVPFVIESFSISRNKDIGDAIPISMVLREIRLIPGIKNKTIISTYIPSEIPTVTDKGNADVNSGTKASSAQKNNDTSKQSNAILKRANELKAGGI
jgi:hypothetical protein